MAGIVLNSDGVRLCLSIILRDYQKHPEAVKRVSKVLGWGQEQLFEWLLRASELKWQPQMKCHICGSEENLKLDSMRLISPDASFEFGYHHITSFQIFSILCQNCIDAGWKSPDEIKIEAVYSRNKSGDPTKKEVRRFP